MIESQNFKKSNIFFGMSHSHYDSSSHWMDTKRCLKSIFQVNIYLWLNENVRDWDYWIFARKKWKNLHRLSIFILISIDKLININIWNWVFTSFKNWYWLFMHNAPHIMWRCSSLVPPRCGYYSFFLTGSVVFASGVDFDTVWKCRPWT